MFREIWKMLFCSHPTWYPPPPVTWSMSLSCPGDVKENTWDLTIWGGGSASTLDSDLLRRVDKVHFIFLVGPPWKDSATKICLKQSKKAKLKLHRCWDCAQCSADSAIARKWLSIIFGSIGRKVSPSRESQSCFLKRAKYQEIRKIWQDWFQLVFKY